MTRTDLYVVVTRLAMLCTPLVVVFWWLDHHAAIRQAWLDHRERSADMRADRARRALRDGWIEIGTLEGDPSAKVYAQRQATVQRPADPSPSPRFVQRFGSTFPR